MSQTHTTWQNIFLCNILQLQYFISYSYLPIQIQIYFVYKYCTIYQLSSCVNKKIHVRFLYEQHRYLSNIIIYQYKKTAVIVSPSLQFLLCIFLIDYHLCSQNTCVHIDTSDNVGCGAIASPMEITDCGSKYRVKPCARSSFVVLEPISS